MAVSRRLAPCADEPRVRGYIWEGPSRALLVKLHAIYLSLGSNVGDARAHLEAALRALPAAGFQTRRRSRLMLTAPVGLRGRWFYNVVVEGSSSLAPRGLARRMRELEFRLGRRRLGPGYAPRVIDLDILLYGRVVSRDRELLLPHPALARRRFLLEGLRDLGALPRSDARLLAAPELRAQAVKVISQASE